MSTLNVSTIKADVQILRAAINKTEIRAPFDGILGFKNISMGAYITPQTIITTISQVNKLKLVLPQRLLPKNIQVELLLRNQLSPRKTEV